MNDLDKIVEFIRVRGPIIPVQAAKEIGTNILMASAMLSQLSSNGTVKVSSLKVGGSPFYYLSGQEMRLQSFSQHLPEKSKRVYDVLQAKKILKDSEQDPLTRTILRQLKDFAKPLSATTGPATELFWKWYLTPGEEASALIKHMLGIEEKKEIQEARPEEEKKEKQEELPVKKEEPKKEKPTARKKQPEKDNFSEHLGRYFSRNTIGVVEQHILRKNIEIDFILEVPSAVGKITYYCKARNKKLITESDLSSTYGKSQLKKLPALLITTGSLNKKALQSAENDYHEIKIIKI